MGAVRLGAQELGRFATQMGSLVEGQMYGEIGGQPKPIVSLLSDVSCPNPSTKQ